MGIVNPQITALAEVTSGWTGTVTATIGGVAVTVTPSSRTSAFAVMSNLGAAIYRVTGSSQYGGWATSAGKFELTGPAVFTVAATGTTEARMGLSGTLSGAASYTFPLAYSGGVTPDYGVNATAPGIKRDPGKPGSNGAVGTAGAREAGGSTLAVFDDVADVVTIAATLDGGGTYDAAIFRNTDGGALTRLRVRSVQLVRWGSTAHHIRVVCKCYEVLS